MRLMKWTGEDDVELLNRGELSVWVEPLQHGVDVSIDVEVVSQCHEVKQVKLKLLVSMVCVLSFAKVLRRQGCL